MTPAQYDCNNIGWLRLNMYKSHTQIYVKKMIFFVSVSFKQKTNLDLIYKQYL